MPKKEDKRQLALFLIGGVAVSRLKAYLEIGQIVSTHGVRGELRVQPWCDSPAVMSGIKKLYLDPDGGEERRVRCRPHQNMVLVQMQGVDTVEQAAALRGRVVYAARRDIPLPKGRYFISDILGAKVVTEDGAEIGVLVDVIENPKQNVYIVRGETEHMIPAVPEFIRNVDVDHGVVTAHLIEGM